jgi:hydroxymethylpyrimidine/phosphomethylpyrimidine kinase
MRALRNYSLSIAGFDPSNGAGLTADVKTFEQHKVYGLSVCTAITLQTEDDFVEVRWEKIEDVIKSVKLLLDKYPVKAIKTGILPSLDHLDQIVSFIHSHYPDIKIIVDPVLRSSTGFDLMKHSNKELFYAILKKCYLLTPNAEEIVLISGKSNEMEAAKEISEHCHVLLKGGHSKDLGLDHLFYDNKVIELKPTNSNCTNKHGSGCILSAAICANIALGHSLEESCRHSKNYVETILASNATLLAYHHVS